MSDIPRRAVGRTARLASLPLGVAGRATIGLGKRLGGRPAEIVATELQQRTAEQLFSVLGQLKGGAMKLGQALSVFEAALPDEIVGPYRAALVKLQEAAPPMPSARVHAILAEQIGPRWRQKFLEFDDQPAAAASIGQVHRARWRDGREVAVKIQYPGAGPALISDLNQLGKLARLFALMQPGLDVAPLVAELKDRVAEELDYQLEAKTTRAFHRAFDGDPDIRVPAVFAGSKQVLVTEWLEGTPLADIIDHGTQQQRDRAGQLMALLHFSAPSRAKLLHADPHPGNFRLDADNRLVVLDFGATARLPKGLPEPVGRLARQALDGDADAVLAGLRQEGFVPDSADIDAPELLSYVAPMLQPLAQQSFQFTRTWMRGEAMRLGDPRGPAYALGKKLNLPPSYLMIHRVTLGTIAVLCQLEARTDYRSIVQRWQPGFADPETGAPATDGRSTAARSKTPKAQSNAAATTATKPARKQTSAPKSPGPKRRGAKNTDQV